MSAPRQQRVFVDDFGRVTVGDLRQALGGRPRFNRATQCRLALDDGHEVIVELVSRPANLAHATMRLPRCPACSRIVTVLRLLPFAPGIGCRHDLRARLAARYRSQVARRRVDGGVGSVHTEDKSLMESPLQVAGALLK